MSKIINKNSNTTEAYVQFNKKGRALAKVAFHNVLKPTLTKISALDKMTRTIVK
ncbi:hypothetical protein COLO4_29899 [Corchorus olitorius]|uniref:Uncharacterized protein n=1 Tax=Corchorus olitorius TaxID=93759 RepID=A0A1R3HCK2_9ROSI|nr:hypothetical protein COLO4_29899 [Corchorus olitorius]